ncbi:MAG: hypothetical protein H6706_19365 [Myxococcales bacterium]|nr:hypothetical protein [Myxococcales bacterium]
MFEVTLRSVSKSSGATLQAILQGSNDLQKWHSITQGSLATAPGRLTVQHDEAVPYRYERLCVIATRSSAPLTPNVNVAATITTFDLST